MAPGAAPQPLSGDFDNPNDGPLYIASVTAVVTGTDHVGCDATDYTVAGTAQVNAQVPAGSGVGSWSGLTIAFHNKPAVNQDACQGATVNISYALAPGVTVDQDSTQNDPTSGSSIVFAVDFSEPVTGFTDADVTLTGTAGPSAATVTGSGATYSVEVSGMVSDGTVTATIGAGVAHDSAGHGNAASTSTDNTVTVDTTRPSTNVSQAAGQADPTTASPINFTVVFSEPVTGLIDTGVTLTGTANASTATVNGSGTTYNVAVSGMTRTGTVTAAIAANAAQDLAGNPNLASTGGGPTSTVDYTDNTAPIVAISTFTATGPF